jgi:quercetin dioxygenase-like cupin family protein
MAIQIGGYEKESIRLHQEGKNDVSIIDWPPGSRTPAHDHNVPEVTYVLEANPRIYQIVNGEKTYHYQGEKIIIPVGIIHEVGVDKTDGPAKTLNLCGGHLLMNPYPSSDIP